ncbi:MAG: hypothetical protein Q8920_13065 [Bacillota bacterium]|nr:hypothetical protein [Bacillota bacterium]
MFTQLFGSYLLNNKLISPEQLKEALEYQKTVHLKLGVLAVNSGFMSADQVNMVHNRQSTVDKKFGEIAIEMGFVDEEKLNILLSTQKSGHLLLGQAIVDKKFMTLNQFEEALNNYKKDHRLTNEQFKLIQNEDIDQIVDSLYNFGEFDGSKAYKDYFSLLVRNIIRFIDDDFKPMDIKPFTEYKADWLASQNISGPVSLYTGVSADEKAFISFAGKHARENYTSVDEYTKASVGEFLNLVNGLFLVNMSDLDIELELNPQVVEKNKNITGLNKAFCVPFEFSFGIVNFIIAKG